MNNKVFFEPPSRLQLLDKLKHMVRFSDFLLLVAGEKGAGKSTLVEHLKPDLSDTTLSCLIVEADSPLSEQQLLDSLLGQLPAHDQGGTGFADHLKLFYLQIKALKAAGQKCLIIIDNAENLSQPALDLLINLHVSEHSSESAQVLFLSNNQFAGSLSSSPELKPLEGRFHQLNLPSMSHEEVIEYLEICHPNAQSLTEKQKQQLVLLSEGLPGRIEALLSGKKVSSNSGSRSKAFPLPALHMGGIGLVLVGILAISLWQFFPEDADKAKTISDQTVSVPIPVPALSKNVERQPEEIEVAETKIDQQLAVKSVPDIKVDQSDQLKAALSERIKEQEEKVLKQKQTEAVQETEPTINALADELREVVAQEIAPAEKKIIGFPETKAKLPPSQAEADKQVAEVQKTPVKSKYTEMESAILGWKGSGYTLQMLGARSKQSAVGFIQSQKDKSNFYYFSTIYKGAPWHVVIYGEFSNRDIANAAIRKLPTELRKIKPWARSVQGVQIDIRKK